MMDIDQLDLNLLKALDALLEARNVTRAAERIGVTQSAMSGMLARLRKAFGDPLFSRARHGVVPTQRARELAGPLRSVLEGAGALLQPPVFDPSTARRTFTIAATDYALRAVALPFIAALKTRAPHVRVALLPIEDRQLQSQMEKGEIDLALVTPESTPPDLHARTLFEEHYVCAVREDHPAVRTRRRLTLGQLCRLDHVLVSYSGGSFRGVTDEALDKLGRRREVSLSVRSFLIVPDILRASDMVAIVPSRLVAGVPGLLSFPPPLEVAGFTKVAAWHERTHRDVAHAWLRSLMFEVLAPARHRATR